MTYQQWMVEVDDCCLLEFGLSIHDLPDMCFYDAYGSGQSAEEFIVENLPDEESLGALILS